MDESTLNDACKRYLAATRATPAPANAPAENAIALAELDEAWAALNEDEQAICAEIIVPFHPADFTR